jgi:thiol-disulfide isomerase/thioredoxin
MKTIIILILLYSIFYITTSCEKIKPPYKQSITPHDSDIDTGTYVQKVLIEDFTGAKCGNCPKAHDKIEELKALYPGQIISIAIHAGDFAKPNLPPYTTYTYDFRTSMGNELADFFHPDYPSGLINRKKINNTWIQYWSGWGSIIDTLVLKKPEIEIEIDNIFDTISRVFKTTIKSDILLNFNATLKLCVFLTEDSIIAWQTDYRHAPPDIRYYTHRHVLRCSFNNNTWGDLISQGPVQAGKSFINIYNYTLNNSWNYKHCAIVAFIYDDNSKEVLQVEEQNRIYIFPW